MMLSRPNHCRPSHSLCRVFGLVQTSAHNVSLYCAPWGERVQIQTVLSRGLQRWGHRCDKPGGAIDVPPCGQTRHGRGLGVGGGCGSVSVLTLARTFSKEAGLTREKHIKNTSWERTREMASWEWDLSVCVCVCTGCVYMELINPALPKSYCPISKLSFIYKIPEKTFLKGSSLVFVKKPSTETALESQMTF